MKVPTQPQEKTLVDRGFELANRLDKGLVVGGLGVAAVGAVISAPTVIAFGAAVTGGSLASLETTRRIDGYRHQKRIKRDVRLGQRATKNQLTLAA